MRFDDRFLEEIKSRVRLSDVIGKTVKLKRQGREYSGLSPFTKEKTPSFYVNDEKGFWHCFSSGKHGDLISFWQETERLSFPEAVERLAAEAGVPMPAQDPRAQAQEQRRQGLQDWLELAAKWFEANLKRPQAKDARAYLAKRGLPEDQWARFRLGYAPAERTGLKDALVQRGAKPSDLVEAGLLIAPEGGGQPYDRFRDRIIFPITDGRGRVVSFGGRAMNPEERAKYLNGPETSLFHKGKILYGLPEARRILGTGAEDGPLVVVEGYMDAIACHRAGVAAVAPMGTALTEDQMEVLWRVHPEPTMSFDGDKAGLRAAYRSLDRALPLLKPGRSFRFALLSGGQDPDDVLREKGPLALKDLVSQTKPFVEVLFQRERDAEPLDTPERRAGLKGRLRQAAAAIQDKDLAEQYRADLLDRFDALFAKTPQAQGHGQGRPWSGGGGQGRGGGRFSRRFVAPIPGLELKHAPVVIKARPKRFNAAVAVAAVRNPAWLVPYVERFAVSGFGEERLSALVPALLAAIDAEDLDAAGVERRLAKLGASESLRDAERVALEATPPPFLDPTVRPETAEAVWARSYELVDEHACILLALETRDADYGEAGNMAERKALSLRRRAIEKDMSDLVPWALELPRS
jgi:DNA primase